MFGLLLLLLETSICDPDLDKMRYREAVVGRNGDRATVTSWMTCGGQGSEWAPWGKDEGECTAEIVDGTFTVADEATSITVRQFGNCVDLTTIVIPNHIERVMEYAFRGCGGLISVTIGSSVSEIEGWAFFECCALETVTFDADSVLASIGGMAFAGCPALVSMTFPATLTTIGESAFLEGGLQKVTFVGKALTSLGVDTFLACLALASIEIPEGITSIPSGCFSMTGLTELVIPEWVTEIPATMEWSTGAFGDCHSLRSVTFKSGSKLTELGESTFGGCMILETVVFEDNLLTSIGDRCFRECHALVSIDLGSFLEKIGNYAFQNCQKLSSIVIPSTLNTIGNNAFDQCSELQTVIFESGVLTSIGQSAFNTCSALKEVKLPEGVTSIDSNCFSQCSSLTSIVLPDSISYIGGDSFLNCVKLTSVTLPVKLESLTGSCFSGCSALTSMVLPSGISIMYVKVFYGCSSLASVELSSALTEIKYNCFTGCSDLTSIKLPESLKSIGNECFSGCSKLTSITFPSELTTLGSNVFKGAPLTCVGSYGIEGPTSVGTSALPTGTNVYVPGDYKGDQFAGCDVVKVTANGDISNCLVTATPTEIITPSEAITSSPVDSTTAPEEFQDSATSVPGVDVGYLTMIIGSTLAGLIALIAIVAGIVLSIVRRRRAKLPVEPDLQYEFETAGAEEGSQVCALEQLPTSDDNSGFHVESEFEELV